MFALSGKFFLLRVPLRCTMRRNNSPDSAWRTQNSDFGSGSKYIVILIDG